MDERGGSEQHGSVGSEEEGTSSKQDTSFEEYKDDGADKRASKFARLEAEEQWAEMETTSGSEYRLEASKYGDSGSESESVDTELEFSDECVETKDKEGSSRERRRRNIVYLCIL